ncbi:unnamed protein product [Cladocopium goreaui]|uniref:Uncharacterized protein n=1 Tax=Cladocopium goreaui TaxID=2562237 RepID=A0A9P1C0V5_9DINO|nr:unnamed protein product [Cladocopium goreaui]
MHNINLGFAQVACGSALLLLTELNFFGDIAAMSFQDRLVVAYKDFKAWCRMNKIYCSHGLFTPNSVYKEKTLGAHISSKAYNCRVLISWLSSCYAIVVSGTFEPGRLLGLWLSENDQEWPEHEMIYPTAIAMNALSRNMWLVETSPRYLTGEQAESIYQTGMLFLRTHILLTQLAGRFGLLFWVLIPKLHVSVKGPIDGVLKDPV